MVSERTRLPTPLTVALPLLPRAAGQGVGLTQSEPRPAVLAVPCSPRRAFTLTLTPPGAQAPTVGVMGAAALQVSTTRPTPPATAAVCARGALAFFCGASGLLRAF